MFRSIQPKAILLAAALLALAGCQDSDERAEAHFRSAMELMEAGDTDRARVEFLNVFDFNGQHREARANLAAMLRRDGNLEQSYSQYLRLAEQYPDDAEAHVALAEMALRFGNWDEARRHGVRALELAPDHPSAPVLEVYLAYLDAVDAEDEGARRAVSDRAMALLEEAPDDLLLQRLALDGMVRDGDMEAALAMTGRALEADPGNRSLHDTRLGLLWNLERVDDAELRLREMIGLFPEDEELPGILLRLLLAQGRIDAAQDLLRDLAASAADPAKRDEVLMALVRLRMDNDGPAAAQEELAAILEGLPEGEGTAFRILQAGLRYDAGDRSGAMAELEALRASGIPLAERGRVDVALAQMRLAEGDEAGAQALIAEVLEQDPGQVEALKMDAAWLIEADEANRAISRLRAALDAEPDDADALTLMANAHARNGNAQLSREFLLLAVEASGSAPDETLRYVTILIEDGRFLPAEELVITALRTTPGHPGLLAALGEIYLALEDWSRAEQVERSLRDIGTAESVTLADELRTAMLAFRGQVDEALAFLEGLAETGGPDNIGAQIAVVRARLVTGDADGALAFAEDLLARDPDNPILRFVLAAVQSAMGSHAEAEALYRGLLEEDPQNQEAWIGLVRALDLQGDGEAARATLEEALQVLPDAPDLLWAQASYSERLGDYEGAIAIYERLYEMMPNAPVVANNLASLISTYREDAESLERAHTIALRLRDSDVAPFRDTYGWIAYRRGEYDDALAHLEPAAAALPEDPLVQFHLGMTYLALDRPDQALEQLRRAIELAGPDDRRPQFSLARERIAALEAAGEPGADDEDTQENEAGDGREDGG
jgi:tetratricopeptide (TPR) repeat protein